MEPDDTTDNGQPQPHPGGILAPGFIGLVEPVEHVGKLLLAEALSRVADHHLALLSLGHHRKGQLPVPGSEFYRIFDQIVEYLLHQILIRLHLRPGTVLQTADLDLPGFDLLLKHK